ncbi:MAG TPA: nitroreductase family deazaflavin-dependent oxidoreductase [Actinomycetota bacterium]|nr:nitroreductase family deazaflavin-dependent oxidoreductase [Actinomycetota bacterium]
MPLLVRALRSAGHRVWFANLMKRIAPPLDRLLHRLTGGRVHVADLLVPTLMLEHVGRRSGQRYRTPLLYVSVRGGGWAVAGTNFGQTHHPAWVLNLSANPDAQVVVRGRTVSVRARPATSEERETIWPDLVRAWPAMNTYLGRAGRDIPIYVLEPR